MFDTILSWLKVPLDWISKAICDIWNNASVWLVGVWTAVLAFFAVVASCFDWLQQMVYRVIEIIGNFTLPHFDLSLSGAIYYLEFANTILPVSETLAFIVSYVSLVGVLYLYKGLKSIKSWIWGA